MWIKIYKFFMVNPRLKLLRNLIISLCWNHKYFACLLHKYGSPVTVYEKSCVSKCKVKRWNRTDSF